MPADLKNAVRQLALTLRTVNFPKECSTKDLSTGDSALLLDVLQYVTTTFSPHVSEKFLAAGCRLSLRLPDDKYCETILRAVLNVLHCRCRLTPSQFMATGAFVVVKLDFVTSVLTACRHIHEDAERAKELSKIRVLAHVAPPPPPLSAYVHPKLPPTHIRPVTSSFRGDPHVSAEIQCSTARCGGDIDVKQLAEKWFSDSVAMGRGAWASSHSTLSAPLASPSRS